MIKKSVLLAFGAVLFGAGLFLAGVQAEAQKRGKGGKKGDGVAAKQKPEKAKGHKDPEHKGSGNKGPDHKGSGNKGPDHKGPDHKGPDHKGPDHKGPDHGHAGDPQGKAKGHDDVKPGKGHDHARGYGKPGHGMKKRAALQHSKTRLELKRGGPISSIMVESIIGHAPKGKGHLKKGPLAVERRKHMRRMIRLKYLEKYAKEISDDEMAQRIARLKKKEQERHAREMKKRREKIRSKKQKKKEA